MKTFRNLLLLFATVSLLSSCIVQEPGYRPRRHGYYHGYYGPWRSGY